MISLKRIVFLLFVLYSGLVTWRRESSYRPSEFLMRLEDEHSRATDGESTGRAVWSV